MLNDRLKAIGTTVGAIVAILSGWWTLESHISTAIKQQTVALAKLYAEDLRLRIVIQQTEIEELKKQKLRIPSHLDMNVRLMQERLQEINEWD